MSPFDGSMRLCLRSAVLPTCTRIQRRAIHYDGRNRLSNFWTPTISKKGSSKEDGHDLLLRAGFLRQAHSGIFHVLPMGLRVLEKVERLIDKHMQQLGASKVSLSSLSSTELWQKSGRLDGRNAELFQLQDRKQAKFLLAPTHEEEITTIVKNAVHSYRDLPLRLYQVSRKYRDEARPRQGLLRGREFIMKDLYTFDGTEEAAMETYDRVRAAYQAFFADLGVPYLLAKADSGNMGGSHSHEFHIPSSKGEDTIISCSNCDMSINEEVWLEAFDTNQQSEISDVVALYGRTLESSPANCEAYVDTKGSAPPKVSRMVQITIPAEDHEVNIHALKKLIPELDTRISLVRDPSALPPSNGNEIEQIEFHDPRIAPTSLTSVAAPFLLTRPRTGDTCPHCKTEGALKVQKAIEIGHTFHLGKRYSEPLEAVVKAENNQDVAIEMGCHGIGVSRLVGAVASNLADDKGLNWPVSIAPFSILVLDAGVASKEQVNAVYDGLGMGIAGNGLDMVIDDREKPIGWKFKDADLAGYPFIVVLGKTWAEEKAVELQCRRLGIKEKVDLASLVQRIHHLRSEL